MKYLSTFTGIGGFELGINKAYESIQNNEYASICSDSEQEECTSRGKWPTNQREVLLHNRDRTAPLCVGYSEIDKYAIQIYEKHFGCVTHKKQQEKGIRIKEGQPSECTDKCANRFGSSPHKNYGDITKIIASELPDFDLFVGGFPCQAFSIAGKRKGFDDTRGTLFFDIARILKEKRPRNFILENVKGLLSHDLGRTFKTIIATLAELGYCVEWQVLNAKNFGVPQNRERVFIVGHLGGIPERKVFPIGTGNEKNELEIDILGHKDCYRRANQVFNPKGITETLSTCGGGGQHPCTTQPFIRNPYNGKQSEVESGTLGTSCGTTTGKTAQLLHKDTRIRRLTPLECERLMGYPDGWTEGLSDTQRYKTLGNGIVSNVVAEVVKRIYQ